MPELDLAHRSARRPFRRALLPLLFALAAGCGKAPPPPPVTLDTIAADYVKFVLAIGEHDPSYVDAYYGPEEWRTAVREEKKDLRNLAWKASDLIKAAGKLPQTPAGPPGSETELVRLRHDYLLQQSRSAATRIAMLQGSKLSFDEESRALYDAVAPTHDDAFFQERLDAIAELLAKLPSSAAVPSDGALRDRVQALRDRVTIPHDEVGPVFDRAIAECRARTAAHLELPAGESFTVEQVTDKPWSAYNWYQGNFRSVIQVNVSLPITIDRAVDLACHEGYPGHHVYNLRLEQKLVKERGWVEFQVYPLFSPQSLIAEGTANFGIEMAFPGEERLAFERDVLYPLAGLDPALAEPYARLVAELQRLSYADNEAARRYLDGEIDAAAAAAWLERYALATAERAAQRIRFIDTYRSYVINYNLGRDLVRRFVDARAAANGEPTADRRWATFIELLSSPRLPSGLAVEPQATE